MKRLVAAYWLILMVMAGGCGGANRDDTAEPGAGWVVDRGRVPQVALADACTERLAPRWHQVRQGPWYQPNYFGFSSDATEVMAADGMMGTAQVYAVGDGAANEAPLDASVHALDEPWRLVARSQTYASDVEVVERGTDRVQATVDLGQENTYVLGAAFGPRSQSVSVVTCQEDRPSVVTWSIEDDAEINRVELDVACTYWSLPSPQIVYTPGGDALVGWTGEDGALFSVDLEDGRVRTAVAHQPTPSEDERLPTQGVLAIAVHPDGHLVASSGADGRVRLWTLPELEPVGQPVEAGVLGVNLNVYAPPHRVSPLAWAPDGSFLAMVAPDGQVVLRDRRGALISHLDAPPIESPFPGETTLGHPNPPVEIAVDAGGRIAVGAYYSVGLWACAAPEEAR